MGFCFALLVYLLVSGPLLFKGGQHRINSIQILGLGDEVNLSPKGDTIKLKQSFRYQETLIKST